MNIVIIRSPEDYRFNSILNVLAETLREAGHQVGIKTTTELNEEEVSEYDYMLVMVSKTLIFTRSMYYHYGRYRLIPVLVDDADSNHMLVQRRAFLLANEEDSIRGFLRQLEVAA